MTHETMMKFTTRDTDGNIISEAATLAAIRRAARCHVEDDGFAEVAIFEGATAFEWASIGRFGYHTVSYQSRRH